MNDASLQVFSDASPRRVPELQANASLLDYGLDVGLIYRTNSGQMIMDPLSMKIMSINDVVSSIITEIFARMGIFVSASSLVKMAIDSDTDQSDAMNTMKGIYMFSMIAHQILNYNTTSIRSINRLLVSVAIILFGLTTSSSRACDDMKRFKNRIKRRLFIDYHLWFLLLAMDMVLTCLSPLFVNLESQFGIESNLFHIVASTYCSIHLGHLMQMIGHGRLFPLIVGTPVLFLDAGDDLTIVKGMFLTLPYVCFWLSDWRELVDWNHSMLCEAGICNLLGNEGGNPKSIFIRANTKFDEWRLDEGLDDHGWFILLDTPVSRSNRRSNQSHGNDDDNNRHPDHNHDSGIIRLDDDREIDYNERLIYLPSRNPLLTSLAAIILVVLK